MNEDNKKEDNINEHLDIKEFKNNINEKTLSLDKILFDLSNFKFDNIMSILLILIGVLCPFTPIIFLFRSELISSLGFFESLFISVLGSCIAIIVLQTLIITIKLSYLKMIIPQYKYLYVIIKNKLKKLNKEIDEIDLKATIIQNRVKDINGRLDKSSDSGSVDREVSDFKNIESEVEELIKQRDKLKKVYNKNISKYEKFGVKLEKAASNKYSIQNESLITSILVNVGLGATTFFYKAIEYLKTELLIFNKYFSSEYNFNSVITLIIFMYILFIASCIIFDICYKGIYKYRVLRNKLLNIDIKSDVYIREREQAKI